MSFSYPYGSNLKTELKKLRKGRSYNLWQGDSITTERLAALKGPIVEIGGPTSGGFYFLDNIELQSKPIITNISARPALYAENASQLAEQVDELMDATKMAYSDGSVAIFLMSAISISSDWWVELEDSVKDKAAKQFEEEFDVARLEMGQVAAGILNAGDVKHAQRVKIYLEVYRCLNAGGLFFSDGGIDEIAILQKQGFELVACLQIAEDYGISYEFVVAKPF
jgi:hypothetical protein